MFDFKMTINGKPMMQANIKSEIDKMMFDAVVESVTEAITSALTEAEAAEITIDLIGNDIQNLSFDVKGPEDIVRKVENALSN